MRTDSNSKLIFICRLSSLWSQRIQLYLTEQIYWPNFKYSCFVHLSHREPFMLWVVKFEMRSNWTAHLSSLYRLSRPLNNWELQRGWLLEYHLKFSVHYLTLIRAWLQLWPVYSLILSSMKRNENPSKETDFPTKLVSVT